MHPLRLLLALPVLSFLAPGAAVAGGTVEVTWSGDAAQYRDIARFSNFPVSDFADIASDFEPIWAELGRRYLPDDWKLTIVVEDLDLAGEFEDWRGPDFQNVRIVRSIYPPAIRFRWTLTRPDGTGAGEDVADLRDLAFDTRLQQFSIHHGLTYEREMLRDWFFQAIRPKCRQ